MLCKKCKTWELLDTDSYCSFCGEEVREVEVKQEPIRLYLDSKKPSVYSATILKNLSPVPVGVKLDHSPAWFRSLRLSKPTIQPNEQLDVVMDIDVTKLGGVLLKEGKLVFAVSKADGHDDGGVSKIEIEVQALPLPQLDIKPLTVASGKAKAPVRLRVDVSSPITLDAIAFDPPFLMFDGLLPMELDVGESQLPFQMNLPQEVNKTQQTVKCELKVSGLQDPIIGSFELHVIKPACLQLDTSRMEGGVEIALIPDAEEELSLTLNNVGEEVLTIDRVQITPVNKQTTKVILRAELARPDVDSGATTTVTLKAAATPDAEPDKYWFQMSFESNDPNLDHNSHNVLITVVDEKYPDFIAMDFGTTDSAVAVFDDKGPASVRLEKGNLDSKVYSNVFFMNVVEDKDPPYEWCIGTKAKMLGPTRRERFVKAIKTKAGTNYKHPIDFKERALSRRLTPEEIIKLIMMDLIRLTKSALGKRPVRFILSVPTLFTKRRKEVLQRTFKEASRALSLNLQSVESVDESLAAALFYILLTGPTDERVNRKSGYSIMVVDFGGGTTDITVLKVTQNLDSDGKVESVAEIQIVGAWGDPTLGGEEITTEIAKVLAEQFLDREIDIDEDIAEIRKLEDEAEAVKLAVSELQNIKHQRSEEFDVQNAVKTASLLLVSSLAYLDLTPQGFADKDNLVRDALDFYSKNQQQLRVRSNDFPGHALISEAAVVGIYESKLQVLKVEVDLLLTKIHQREGLTTEANSRPKVDILLLAGQSSQFPLVAKILGEVGDHIDFIRDVDGKLLLKECVSLGALYYSFILHGHLDIKLTGTNKIWTRIGRPGFRIGIGRQFQEVIPWGHEYPCESNTFRLTDEDIEDENKLILRVFENLTMRDEPKLEPRKEFELVLDDSSPKRFNCKLVVDEQGDIGALCQIAKDWIPMIEIKS